MRTRSSTLQAEPVALITGAGGYTGRYLLETLCKHGYKVIAADICSPTIEMAEKIDQFNATWCHLDLTSIDSIAQLFTEYPGIHTIFHCAAIVPYNFGRRVSDLELHHVNVTGTETLLTQAQSAAVRRFVFVSSTGVVFSGNENIAGADESLLNTGQFNDSYSQSKSKAELSVLQANSPSFRTIALRPNGIWGPHEQHHLPKVLAMARAGMSGVGFGVHTLTDFTHARNLAHALLCADQTLADETRWGGAAGQALFITDEWPVSTTEFFAPILHALHFPTPFTVRWLSGSHSPVEYDVVAQATQHGCAEKRDELRHEYVVSTSPPTFVVPTVLVMLGAHLLHWLSTTLRPVYSFEPYLTPADVRKCTVDNYYSCKNARDLLNWTPPITTTEGLVEVITSLQAQGFDGRVHSPAAIMWAAVLVGLGAVAALHYLALLPLLAGAWVSPQLLQWMALGIKAIWYGAVASHVVQAIVAAVIAWQTRTNTAGWAWQTFLLGFPSMQMLLGSKPPVWLSAQAAPMLGVGVFMQVAITTAWLGMT